MNRVLKSVLKAVIPKPVRKRLVMFAAARRHKEFYFGQQLRAIYPTLLATDETHNFTYDLTECNLRYLAETIAVVTGKPPSEIDGYLREPMEDAGLRSYFAERTASYRGPKSVSSRYHFGRRLGWYAVARAIKPRVVVETGVERGHGALILCAALLQNRLEGAPGRYFGTDIDPEAGWLLGGKYAEMGQILYGDSITSLKNLNETIDLFINDSDHCADYEGEEYRTVAPRLSQNAIVLGDNSHVTDKLALFSRATGRSFLMFREVPKDHWYPGGGIGISFPRR